MAALSELGSDVDSKALEDDVRVYEDAPFRYGAGEPLEFERRCHLVRHEQVHELVERHSRGIGRLSRSQPTAVKGRMQHLNEPAGERLERASLFVRDSHGRQLTCRRLTCENAVAMRETHGRPRPPRVLIACHERSRYLAATQTLEENEHGNEVHTDRPVRAGP